MEFQKKASNPAMGIQKKKNTKKKQNDLHHNKHQ
jgi:hypothetical protein